ncbi:tetratricopeptide repeat protein [Pelagibacterales bacterium]|nr:tetratricopeptide repeat protein [Pelagibacterales bacterium]
MFLIRVLFLFIFSISIAAAAGGGGSSGGGDKDNAEWKLYKSQLSEIVKFINNKDYDMALSKAEAFVYANPEDANGWNYAGFTSRKLKKYDDAERYYKTGLEINPKHAGILEYQGELYLETNRLDLAKENLAKLEEYCSFNCTERDELRDLINEKISSAY